MPDVPGRPGRWPPFWLATAAVLAVAGVLALAVRLPGPSHGSPWATPSVSVVTAPTSTAPTPSAAPSRSRFAPAQRATVATRRAACEDREALTLRVLQFNIRAGISDTGDVDLAQIAAEIEAVHPDLVSVNEVDSGTLRTRLDEPAYLAGATGLRVVYGPNLRYDGGRFGNAILTRYPVVESQNLRLPGTFGQETRGLLTAVVRVEGRSVAFSSLHLSNGNGGRQSRTLQALAVAQALRSTALPRIVAGDLNSVPTDVPARILRGFLLDAQEEGGAGAGDTIPEPSPTARFDYVLYDHHFAVVPGSTRVQPSESSDHASVFTKLALLPNNGC